jgi:hypothetical protein
VAVDQAGDMAAGRRQLGCAGDPQHHTGLRTGARRGWLRQRHRRLGRVGRRFGTSAVALNDAEQASGAWSVLNGQTGLLTRSPSGTWGDTIVTARTTPAVPVSTAIDGAGNAIAVFGSSYSWHLAGGSWQTGAALPSGSSGGLTVADPAGTFVYANTSGDAFTFSAGATSFGAGSGSLGSLADLKIVPGKAVMLVADAVSAESVS